jgi:hypothetical protein
MGIDWNDLPWWLILIPAGMALFAAVYFSALQEHRAGRWEQFRNCRGNPLSGMQDDGCLALGLVSLFSAGIWLVRFEIHWLAAGLLGILTGVLLCVALATILWLFQRAAVFMIEKRHFGGRLTGSDGDEHRNAATNPEEHP